MRWAYNNPMRTMLTVALLVSLVTTADLKVRTTSDVVHAFRPADGANTTLTAVPGIKVGHVTLAGRPTGCTVILVDGDAVGGVSQRGGAPGTRETDLLSPLNMVDKVNAIVLAGGRSEERRVGK